MCFVKIYLVYSEMFIPKITTGIFEESDRGSHTYPFDQTPNYPDAYLNSVLGKFDAQTKAPCVNESAQRKGKKSADLGNLLGYQSQAASGNGGWADF
jgi:hypothetical protein